MTPTPIYEVNQNHSPHYPWGFHYQVHLVREAQGPIYAACEPDDPRLERQVVGIFDVDAHGALRFRGRYTSLRDALGGLLFHALAGLDYGRYDPYTDGVPLEAVNVMLIRLDNTEIHSLLQQPDLLSETMRALGERVDQAMSAAIQAAAEAVFVGPARTESEAA